MKSSHFYTVIFLMICLQLAAQKVPPATSSVDRLKGFENKRAISDEHILQNLEFKSVGPTIMGGRVTDVEVNPDDPTNFYIAYASGGLWYTENNGQSYTPIFDNQMVISIGDIAIDWEKNIIWLGSGENNSSRSSYSGFGMYKSDDNGKSWQHFGLEESHHIGRIILHPSNSDVLWVAVLGHLYSSNDERGVYKTSDGGKSWEKVLFIDENTGAIDLIIHPKNPDILYAAMWHRERKAWNFVEGGKESGIYRSEDGGENWVLKTGIGSGFPTGDGIGRIGLAITSDGKVVYAVLDNQNRRPKEEKEEKGMQKKELREMTGEAFLKLDKKDVEDYLEKYDFPKELDVDSINTLIKSNKIEPFHLVDYVEDANRNLFDTEVTGAEVYTAYEGADYWVRTHEKFLDDLVYSYGYYFGQIRVSPIDNLKIYIVGVPILKSEDGGKTFVSINGDNQHVDHHALWVSPEKDGHLINGNDGGINISYDDGENWLKVKSPPVGQFYTVNVDMAKPYFIYGGLQDNGVWVGSSNYKEGSSWESVGSYPYKRILGGDGFNVEIDNRDNKTVYTGYQFGHYFRFNRFGGSKTKVTPKHKLGERPLRFNWQTPIYLSRHNQDIFYFGSNKFHRSMDKGNSFDLVSDDMTKGGKDGDVAFGTITVMHESDLRFGLIYLGTDDGMVYRSDDAGYNWQLINESLPENLWVSSIQASAHDPARVYLSLNGYRWDHMDAYVYVSNDYGNTWNRIGNDLPLEPVNVVKEDPKNDEIVYVGTDHGLYISLDKGKRFMFLNNGIPAVPVHDLVVQPRENHLVVASHGRSIYKADVSHVQKLKPSIREKGIHFFKLSSVTYNKDWGKKYNAWKEAKEPKIEMVVYAKEDGVYEMQVNDKSPNLLYSRKDTLNAGLNYLSYDLSFSEDALKNYSAFLNEEKKDTTIEKGENGKYYLRPSTYDIHWIEGEDGIIEVQKLEIKKREKK